MKAALCCLALCAGCVSLPRDCAVADKVTVLGLDVSPYGTSGPHVRLGLVRHFYQHVPVSTNQLYAPPYSADVVAGVGVTQNTTEKFAVGKGPP